MDSRRAIKRQYRAAIQMMRQAIEVTPDELWTWGEHPRTYWRIVYHTLAYAHLYLYENLDSWQRWPMANNACAVIEGDVDVDEPYSRKAMIELCDLILNELDSRLDAMNLDDTSCGFAWYPTVSRFELLLLSLRHIHGHLGQLHEHLIARGLDLQWLGPPIEFEC